MNYNLMPSLGHIALVKTAVTLWNQHDIKNSMTKYSSLLPRIKKEPLFDGGIDWEDAEKWRAIERKVLNNVTQLGLPECLKKKLSGVVKPIGLELFNCMEYHYRQVNGKSCGLPGNLHWTSVGKVDKKTTAAELIKDENIHIADRFVLACNYCLEDEIFSLWESMSGSMRAYVCGDKQDLNNESGQLVELWTWREESPWLNDRLRSLQMSLDQFGFKVAASSGNKPATEYYLERLNPVEREKCLMEYKCNTCYSDVLCFLLSQMNEEEQIAFFSKNAFDVLRCLLKWPLQSFFKETFARICKLNFLEEEEFYDLLDIIVRKIGEDFSDYNYKKLLEQFWLLSPCSCKKYVICDWAESEDVTLMTEIARAGNVMLILNNATIQEREKIIFNNVDCLVSLVRSDSLNTLKLLIQECVSSTESLIKLKSLFVTEYEREFSSLDAEVIEKEVSQINQLMDELMNKKRSIEEGKCSQAKRPRILDKEENDKGV